MRKIRGRERAAGDRLVGWTMRDAHSGRSQGERYLYDCAP